MVQLLPETPKVQVEFDLFQAAEKTFTCGNDRLTVVPEGAEELP